MIALIDWLEAQRVRDQLGPVAADPTRRGLSGPAGVLLDAVAHHQRAAAVRARNAIRQMRSKVPADAQASASITGPAISSVLLKPVGDFCNLRCSYCYEGDEYLRRGYPKMSPAMLENAIREVLAQARGPIRFSWHGGEPLMAGLPLFRAGMEYQRKHNVCGVEISNGVQTNGLLLTPQWLDFFEEHAFDIGISIDGTMDIHDAARIGPGGRGSYDKVVAALNGVQERGLQVGAISVIDERHRGRAGDVYRLFRDLDVRNYDVHPNFGMRGPAEGAIHPRAFADFVIELFDCWLEGGAPGIRIATFDDIVASALGTGPSICYFAGTCTSIIAIDANGDVLPCTRPFDRTRYTFGNIGEQGLTEIVGSRPFREFRSRDMAAQDNTATCRWHAMCHNGCPQHRTIGDRQEISGKNLYCQCQSGIEGGFAAIFEHATGRIQATWCEIVH